MRYATKVVLAMLMVLIIVLISCRAMAMQVNGLFPADLPAAKWVEFQAAGYDKPVTGIIFRDGTMLPGMPLGALGTGFVSLGTDGTLDHLATIFSDYMVRGRGKTRESVPSRRLPFLGLSVGGKTTLLALNQPEGIATAKQIHYWGHYPIADLEYETGGPIAVGLRAWTPLIPDDEAASNTPGAVFEARLRNESDQTQRGALAFSFDGPGANWSMVERRAVEGEFNGVEVHWADKNGFDRQYAIGLIGKGPIRVGGALGCNADAWNQISRTLPPPTPDKTGASVAIDFSIEPGREKVFRFVLAWYAPKWRTDFGNTYVNKYADRFAGAAEVAQHLTREHRPLLRRVAAWQQVVYAEDRLPGWLRDALVNVTAILAQNSFLVKSADPGHWWGTEGFFCVNESLVSAPQQACIACDQFSEWVVNLLFPKLGLRKLRAYKHYQKKDTGQTPSTLGRRTDPDCPFFNQQLAIDGQVYVHMVDRYRLSASDDKILDEWYPSVKAAMKFMFTVDGDHDGLPDVKGTNHYLDVWKMQGAAVHVSMSWLATLRIAERMARLQSDETFAAECRHWYEKAARSLEDKLWNEPVGSYLLYHDTAGGAKSDTVVCDQLIGQMFAQLHNLPDVLPADRVNTIMKTLERLNVPATPHGIRIASRPDGGEDTVCNYSRCIIPSYSTLSVAIVMVSSGQKDFEKLGLEIVRRCWHNMVFRQNMAWDMPCMLKVDGTRNWGVEYYHNTMLWAFPLAVLKQDIHTACSTGGFIYRIREAGRELTDRVLPTSSASINASSKQECPSR